MLGAPVSRNSQPLRVIIAHRLFLAYCTNIVIFQTETKRGIFICGHEGLVQETNSLINSAIYVSILAPICVLAQ